MLPSRAVVIYYTVKHVHCDHAYYGMMLTPKRLWVPDNIPFSLYNLYAYNEIAYNEITLIKK